MGVGDLGEQGQRLAAGGDDDAPARLPAGRRRWPEPALALGLGGLADRLDLLGGVAALRAGCCEGDLARVIEDGVELELEMGRFGHQ
jgi:hypothetical protein